MSLSIGARVAVLEVNGLPALRAEPPLVDPFDDLAVAARHDGVAIERQPARMYDEDPGLLVAASSGGFFEYDVPDLVDFALRGYRFCQRCVNEC